MVLKPFRDIPVGISFFGLSFLSFILFRFFSVSINAVVTEPVRLQRLLLSDFVGLGELTGEAVSMLGRFALPLVSVSVLFSVVAIYLAREKENLFLAPAAVAAGAIAGISFAGLGFETVGLGLGLVVSTLVVQRDIEESREGTRLWKSYPATSGAAEKGFLAFNVFLVLGVAASIFAGFPTYQDMYSEEIQKGMSPSQMSDEQLVQLMDSSLKEKYDTLTLGKKKAFLEDYRTFLEEQPASPTEDVSGAATAYLFLLPLLVFGVLEVLRSLVLAPLAGLGSSVMT